MYGVHHKKSEGIKRISDTMASVFAEEMITIVAWQHQFHHLPLVSVLVHDVALWVVGLGVRECRDMTVSITKNEGIDKIQR